MAALLVVSLVWLPLAIPLVWALFALLLHSFYSIDEFSGMIVPEFTLQNFAEIFTPANLDVVRRTVTCRA